MPIIAPVDEPTADSNLTVTYGRFNDRCGGFKPEIYDPSTTTAPNKEVA